MGRPPWTMRGERGPGWLALAGDGVAMAGRSIAGRTIARTWPLAARGAAPAGTGPTVKAPASITAAIADAAAATVTTVRFRCHRETEALACGPTLGVLTHP